MRYRVLCAVVISLLFLNPWLLAAEEEVQLMPVKEMLFGLVNPKGQLVIPVEYQEIKDFVNGLAVVKKNGKYGCVNKAGQIVVPLEFDGLGNFESAIAKAQRDNRWGYIDRKGNVVTPMQYDEVFEVQNGYARVRVGDNWGLVDSEGKLVISPQPDPISNVSEGFVVYKENGKFGFMDFKGSKVILATYDVIGDFHEGLAAAGNYPGEKMKRKYSEPLIGFIDKTGSWVIPPHYDTAGHFSDGLVAVREPGKHDSWDGYFFIDKTGKETIDVREDESSDTPSFENGKATLSRCSGAPKSCTEVTIDKTGRAVSSKRWLDYDGGETPANESIPGVQVKQTVKYVKVLIKQAAYGGEQQTAPRPEIAVPDYQDEAVTVKRYFHEWMAVEPMPNADEEDENRKYGYINYQGVTVVKPEYSKAREFSEGRAWVQGDGLWGAIDKTGKKVIPNQFDAVEDFSHGVASVQKGGYFGVIDQWGAMIIPLRYESIKAITGGRYLAEKNQRYVFFEKDGKSLDKNVYLSVEERYYFGKLQWIAMGLDGKKCLLDETGNRLFGGYDGIEPSGDDFCMVSKVLSGYKKAGGELAFECFFDEAFPFVNGTGLIRQAKKWIWLDGSGKQVGSKTFAEVATKDEIGWIVPAKNGLFNAAITRKFSPGSVAPWENNRLTRWGFIDSKGNWVVPAQFTEMPTFSDGLAIVHEVKDDGAGVGSGVIDENGTYIVSPEYQNILSATNGMFLAEKGDRWGLLDREGRLVIKPEYEKLDSFKGGLAFAVKDEGKPVTLGGKTGDRKLVGFMDEKGKWNIKREFVVLRGQSVPWEFGPFSEGLASYRDEKTHLAGFINKKGKVVIKPQFGYVTPFKDGKSSVSLKVKDAYVPGTINLKGDFTAETRGNNESDAQNSDWSGYLDQPDFWH